MGKNQLITNLKQFRIKANKIHKNFYNYSKADYKGTDSKILIICKRCFKEFWQTPHHHLNFHGCPNCGRLKMGGRINTTENFIKKAKLIHGNKYNYSKVKYIHYFKPINIICPKHGEFKQTPSGHLCRRGCKFCGREYLSNIRISNTQEFIKKAKKTHGNKYDYSKVVYKNACDKVCIICAKHGKFYKTPNSHLTKNGGVCLKCSILNRPGMNYKTYFKNGKNPKATLYFVEFKNVKEKFYKIGITLTNIKTRFRDNRYSSYKIKEIWTKILPLKDAWKIEQNIKEKYKKFQYIPSNFNGGKTECFFKIINL